MNVSIFQNRTHYRVTLIFFICILCPASGVISATFPKPDVISRTEWDCPDGQSAPWNYSYRDVTHIIVHHTGVYKYWSDYVKNNDWAEIVLLIWEDHVKYDRNTKTRSEDGWPDIGYNYLIDPQGKIYEGRAGGDNIVGAHFSGYNNYTMGVVLLGDFEQKCPTPASLASLKYLLAWKCDQRNLDPLGRSVHAASNLNLYTISGHRDIYPLDQTDCPGKNLYGLLPNIRQDVKDFIDRQKKLPFTDVSNDDWYRRWVEEAYIKNLMTPWKSSPLQYKPDDDVTRGLTAKYLLRTLFGTDYTPEKTVPDHIFADMWDHPQEIWAEDLYYRGLSSGCSDEKLLFCPNQALTRAEMAVFLLRGIFGSNFIPDYNPNNTPIFDDLKEDTWKRKWAEELFKKGLTAGCNEDPLLFCPDRQVTRAEMAVFLLKLLHNMDPKAVYGDNYFMILSTLISKNYDPADRHFILHQNYPNPFNSNTTILYHVPIETNVSILIFDVNGRLVKSLVNAHHTAGDYSIIWDASFGSSGLYFYKIVANDYSQVKKLTILK